MSPGQATPCPAEVPWSELEQSASLADFWTAVVKENFLLSKPDGKNHLTPTLRYIFFHFQQKDSFVEQSNEDYKMQPGNGVSKPDLAFLASNITKPLICTPQSSNFSQGYVPLTLF